MAYQNGVHKIGSIGTLSEFFETLSTEIPKFIDWQLISVTELAVKFQTNMNDIICEIKDYTITDTSSTTNSNKIRVSYLNGDNVLVSDGSLNYSSGMSKLNDVAERTLTLSVFENKNIKYINLSSHNAVGYDIGTSTSLSEVTTINMTTEQEEYRYWIANTLYGNSFSPLYRNNQLSYDCNAIVMLNILLFTTTGSSSSNPPSIVEYVKGVYNCTNINLGKYYKINGKNYFALSDNILVET